MTPTELIAQYRVVLQERYTLMQRALDSYSDALTELLPASGLPEPSVVARGAPSSSRDLSTVLWRQEVTAARTSGPTTVIVGIELTVSLAGFHCAVRDTRNAEAPLLYETTQRRYVLPTAFVEHARNLANDPTLPRDRWNARIYTY